jgi:hypothetical protein
MRPLKRLLLPLTIGLLAATPFAVGGAIAAQGDATDPARNAALPCESVSSPALVARSAKNLSHLANVCGIVGTDVELQSRKDAAGKVHDYAFVGTMGAGLRIFDVTDPAHPTRAGGYVDSGWQNDIQVRGNVAVATFDGVSGEDSSASACLKEKNASGQGVDIYRLDYDAATAKYAVALITCVANPPGGAHNSTLHPSGNWLAISNCCSDWAVDVVDLRRLEDGKAALHKRLIDGSKITDRTRCPAGAHFQCVEVFGERQANADGKWRPHDVHFSDDGTKMYVAAINSTFIVDVSRVMSGRVRTLALIPNSDGNAGDTPNDLTTSHQADVSPDGKILVVSDERGGGINETRCNEDPDGMMGALHFYALDDVKGVPATRHASHSNPVKLGIYVNPSPNARSDALAPAVALLPRTERGCTVHVFRIGGNGSVSPGPAANGLDGVSRLSSRELVTAWYGGGVWMVDFGGRPSNADGIAEDRRTTWGNTRGWVIMPGADTWSAKEYKGAIYAGDMLRGFDVYRIGDGASKESSSQSPVPLPVAPPVSVPGIGIPAPALPGLPAGTIGVKLP